MSLKKVSSRLLPNGISIRVRLALLFVTIFGVVTLLFNLFLFKIMIDTLQQDFDDALFNYCIDVAEGVEIGIKGDLNFPPLRLDHGKVLPFPLGTALIQVRHSSGAVLARVGNFGSFNPQYKADFEKIWKGEEATYRTIEQTSDIPSAEADSYRLISFPLDSTAKPQLLLQIAVPMTLMETQIAQRLRLLKWGIPAVFIIATLGGLLLSSSALTPLKNMIKTAKKIKANDLSGRVPVPQTNDEIQTLANTFNDMLDRIEQAFHSQERFVADASHQLRTPLTIMRGELELRQKNEDTKLKPVFQSLLQEVDHLADIVNEMLMMSRVDAGIGALNLESLRLDEVLLEVLPRFEKLAQKRNIKVVMNIDNDSSQEAPLVQGDNDLLRHLFLNIIENAIKYSPENATIFLKLFWQTDSTVVEIQDQGGGIPEEQMPYIFDRFSRGSNVDNKIKGFGLGLSIAQKIAALHSATLDVTNKEGGAAFRFEIKNI